MYIPHPSRELNELFTAKPYQGVAPDRATFLFIGLDANYHAEIETQSIFSNLRAYHADGVAFWQMHGVHHPFLLPRYSGDGRLYHQSFSRIGFTPEHAPLVSFIELLHVPTVGRNKLSPDDLSVAHLKSLNALIFEGPARHIFISAGVARLMRESGHFPWLPQTPSEQGGPLRVWFRDGGKKVYSHLHFSVYGKFAQQKAAEAVAIRGFLSLSNL